MTRGLKIMLNNWSVAEHLCLVSVTRSLFLKHSEAFGVVVVAGARARLGTFWGEIVRDGVLKL